MTTRWAGPVRLAVGGLLIFGACCRPQPRQDEPPEQDERWPILPNPYSMRASLSVTTDGPLVAGRTVTITATVRAEDEFDDYLGINLRLPDDMEAISVAKGDMLPLRRGETKSRTIAFRIPTDDVERAVVVAASGEASDGAGSWHGSEVLVINPGGRPKIAKRCGPRSHCLNEVPMDLEASGPLRPGATVDLTVRAVDVPPGMHAAFRFDLPGDVTVVSGAIHKGPVAISGPTGEEEHTIRIRLPDDGRSRTLRGAVQWWPAPDPAQPSRQADAGFRLSLETLGNRAEK